jgi:hypothetical protein
MSVIALVFSFDLNGCTGSGPELQDKAEKSLMQITIGIDISKEAGSFLGNAPPLARTVDADAERAK